MVDVPRPVITGYADRFSVAPGETVEFKISCDEPGEFQAEVVRLRNGDTNPAGPGFLETVIDTAANGRYPGRKQEIHPGSAVLVQDGGGLALGATGALHVYAQPTTPAVDGQTLLSRWDEATRTGWWLGLVGGRLTLRLGDGTVVHETSADAPLLPWIWYSVTASWAGGTTEVGAVPTLTATNSLWSPAIGLATPTGASGTGAPVPGSPEVPTVLAAGWDTARGVTRGHLNGKLDSPAVFGGPLDGAAREALARGERPAIDVLARYDFGADIGPAGVPSDRCSDIGPNGWHGVCHNAPYRAMTGWNWSGEEENYRHAPEQYGAIHFTDDALEDAGWTTDVRLTVPDDLHSGVYALRTRLGDSVDHIPFWVLPPRGTATEKVLLLFPTASYLAYANDHIVPDVPVAQSILGHTSVMAAADLHLLEHPEYGLSTYDHHNDGSGVAHTSRLRPITTMRPGHRHTTGSLWQFPADLHLVDWLTGVGLDFDVATDEDLDAEGVELLSRYSVVLTGTHPEYYSARMLDAWETYLGTGGRGMYLGANGFYWVTSFHPDKPHLVEVRKGEGGCRAWQARPGELHMAFTPERGGIWRNRGRAPQKLFGVGFTTEGMDRSSAYDTLADFASPHGAFIVEGCAGATVIGDHGLVGGGAAGHECDRYDLTLGTPPNALLLATSAGRHSDNYPLVAEDIYFPFDGLGGTDNFQVRADIVYMTTANGGGVFSTGSIAWSGSLAHNGYDNDISRITGNVLRRFLDPTPLEPLPSDA
ncbi:N,N-dimethylformamidase beta subunit family domain-containing protein [Geodermatophilus sabuli]|uniref:N,N-dimethylformamidase n=1 Tax=Geodermatophilus sabuli TaxID=1564158 RepID=A0A285EBS5_9ACTN|nr:N,N-dimethylformamidase beta subunit family domain-containing protein [Geodermatophilus sabuli]MBB3084157.1 N,N-dimethylformamidase [Geodermatophilus sabuli]SNX96569.1 N,N-dimethylformamidase [Geodermatophilus sabuli]